MKKNNLKQLKEMVNVGVLEAIARIAWRWLNTRHLFGDDSEAVTLTGWQYLGVAAVAIVCGLLFSIKF